MQLHKSINHRPTTVLAWILVCLAHLSLEIVVGETHGKTWEIAIKFIVVALLSGGILFDLPRKFSKPTGLITLLSLLAMIGPMVFEPIWRLFTHGHAFEIQLLIGFRNLALVLIVLAASQTAERLAVICSLFVLLFCVSTSNNWGLSIVCAIYLLVGCSWLFVMYWSDLKTERVVGKQGSAPWFVLASAVVFAFAAVSCFVLPNSPITRMAQGFMPSSGGTEDYSPEARSGVGDGDALVAATDNAMSFAPLEEAPFVEGTEPSLYDVLQETYGVAKPPKGQDRAISLPAEMMQKNHHKMAKAKKSSRTFSLIRNPPENKKHRHLKDTESNAILHLVGRVPLHLRHTTYSIFDGYEWFPEELEEDRARQINLYSINEKPWMSWNHSTQSEVFAERSESHALRVLNVDTNRILSPINLSGVHIDKVDRENMFVWKQNDILAMDRKKLPSLTIIHLVSSLVDEYQLQGRRNRMMAGRRIFLETPVGSQMKEISNLAKDWTKDCETNWERIVAIRERLRSEYLHDPDIVVPEDCKNPVAWFLMESKKGPDHLFASSAIMMYRSLGIASRAVSGFYASPEKYNGESRETSVHPSDVHWWAEVYLGGQIWTTIEPTPGFYTLQPERSWIAKCVIFITTLGKMLIKYWPLTLLALAIVGFACIYYRRIWSMLLTMQWRLSSLFDLPNKELRPVVLNFISVLDKKLILADQPRPISNSFGTYLRVQKKSSQSLGSVNSEELELFSRICDWASYSPSESAPFEVDRKQFHSVCQKLLSSLFKPSRKQQKER